MSRDVNHETWIRHTTSLGDNPRIATFRYAGNNPKTIPPARESIFRRVSEQNNNTHSHDIGGKLEVRIVRDIWIVVIHGYVHITDIP